MAPLSPRERSCWKHQERSIPLSGQHGIGSKAAGLSNPLAEQGPTTPGSRLRGQSPFLERDVPHIPAQHLELATG